jgi:hypothetical protein
MREFGHPGGQSLDIVYSGEPECSPAVRRKIAMLVYINGEFVPKGEAKVLFSITVSCMAMVFLKVFDPMEDASLN